MSRKEPNTGIRCRIESCAFHCGDCNCCSLQSIRVEPCRNCGSGRAEDETMCASYRHC